MHGINLLSHKANIEGGLISITECRDGKAKNYGKRGQKGETVRKSGVQRTAKRGIAALFCQGIVRVFGLCILTFDRRWDIIYKNILYI